MKSLFLLLAFILISTSNSPVCAEDKSTGVGKAPDSSAGPAKICDEPRKAVPAGDGKGEVEQPEGAPVSDR